MDLMHIKIGLIGNMNNNNFSLMRYFRDLGVDAHLVLYSNDGKGTNSHFTPESDTWDIRKWNSFIHQSNIPNSPTTVFDFPISSLLYLWSKLKNKNINARCYHEIKSTSRAQLRDAYKHYNCLIGSGSTPAALLRINKKLDIFYPYSPGVEFLGAHHTIVDSRGSFIRKLIYKKMRYRQLRGLQHASCVVCTDTGITRDVLCDFNIPFRCYTIPMVYNREILPSFPPSEVLKKAFLKLQSSSFSLIHHARLKWKKLPLHTEYEHLISTKNSDWLIHAIAQLLTLRPSIKLCLFILEYGPDIDHTKKLVDRLGINDAVCWLPKMPRRELMWLLNKVNIVVGEFMNPPRMIWGGTGWEAFASGKPLLQRFQFEQDEFENIYCIPPPPMLSVNSQKDVLLQLLYAVDHPQKIAEIGHQACEWFNTHNGITLAEEWLTTVSNTLQMRKLLEK